MAQDGGSKLVAGGTWAPASEEGTGNPVQLGGKGGIGEVKPHPDDHCFDCAALKRGDPLGEDAAGLFFAEQQVVDPLDPKLDARGFLDRQTDRDRCRDGFSTSSLS